jgi:mono/diheme cytochrome c family protein
MKKISIIAVALVMIASIIGCSNYRRNPGRVYMPDMAYSRAYETYASTEALMNNPNYKGHISYTSMPVAGTMARGEMLDIYPYKNDSIGYVQSAGINNPFNADSIDIKEAERLYLINCGICHGAKLDGNGPLYNDGKGPFPNAPKNLMGDDMKKMADGTMFHSVTYGKNSMGSYASQLSTKQRWMVIAYIKKKQGPAIAATATPAADTAKAVKP